MGPDDEPVECLHCGSDLRRVGILEYGLVAFEIDLEWKAEQGLFSSTSGESRFESARRSPGGASSAGMTCRRTLTTSPLAITRSEPRAVGVALCSLSADHPRSNASTCPYRAARANGCVEPAIPDERYAVDEDVLHADGYSAALRVRGLVRHGREVEQRRCPHPHRPGACPSCASRDSCPAERGPARVALRRIASVTSMAPCSRT
jgi:hypothetical protein